MYAIMAMQMESSICTHSEYVTAKGTGGFTVRFLFFAFSKKLFKKVLTNRESGVIMITEIKGSDRPLEVKYALLLYGIHKRISLSNRIGKGFEAL